MSTYIICSECRQSLLAKGRRARLWQWSSRAHFISLNKSQSTTDDNTEDILNIADVDNAKRGLPRVRREILKDRATKTTKMRSVDLLESLFEEGRTQPPVGEASPQNAILSKLYGHLENLKRLLNSKDEPIEGVWAFFMSNLGPEAWNHNGRLISRPLAFTKVISKLLHKVNNARRGNHVAGMLPSSSEIMALYASMGMQDPGVWNAILWDMIQKIYGQTDSPNLIYSAEDLLGAWDFLCKSYSKTGTAPYNLSRAHNRMPKAKVGTKFGAEERLGRALLCLLPRYPLNHLGSISSAALATFAVLVQHPLLANEHKIKEHPFIVAVAKILSDTGADKVEIRGLLQQSRNGSSALDSAGIDWSSILQNNIIPPKEESRIKYRITRPLAFNSAVAHKQLGRAVMERDLPKIDQLWEDTKLHSKAMEIKERVDTSTSNCNQPTITSNESKGQSALSQELCNHFILAYMGLRQSNRAIHVWNYMVEKNMQPTLSTWNAMLEGCKSARNLTSLESVWAKLQASNVKPDMACWTTRISGLAECGKPDLAIRALNEMGHIWMQAANRQKITAYQEAGDIDGFVKPTIQTINAAISGLLRRQNAGDAVNRILLWGSTLGIQPDIITFNTLLRSLVRNGSSGGVQALLSQMQKANVQADVATFTTLLEEMFKSSKAQSPEEQNEIVQHVFAEMEAAGIEANLRTYSKIIYSLLHSSPGNMTAVKAVMTRMAAKGVEPSTYIYTILIKHHFSQQPPNIEAVRLILERIRLSGAVMDHIFWDRVIEGYAHVGDTTTALTILGRVDRPGSRVGWPALQMVLTALAENNEWDLARQVVRNAWTDRGGPPKPDEKGVEGQHNFWITVADLGLTDG